MYIGGYGLFRPVDKNDLEVLSKAYEGQVGVLRAPVFAQTQVVAGRNYRIFCNENHSPADHPYPAVETIFVPLPSSKARMSTSVTTYGPMEIGPGPYRLPTEDDMEIIKRIMEQRDGLLVEVVGAMTHASSRTYYFYANIGPTQVCSKLHPAIIIVQVTQDGESFEIIES